MPAGVQSLCELTDDQWKSMQIPEGFVNAHCGSPLRADGVIWFKVQVDIYYMEPLGRIEDALTNWMVKIRTATKLTRDLPRRNCRRKGTE